MHVATRSGLGLGVVVCLVAFAATAAAALNHETTESVVLGDVSEQLERLRLRAQLSVGADSVPLCRDVRYEVLKNAHGTRTGRLSYALSSEALGFLPKIGLFITDTTTKTVAVEFFGSGPDYPSVTLPQGDEEKLGLALYYGLCSPCPSYHAGRTSSETIHLRSIDWRLGSSNGTSLCKVTTSGDVGYTAGVASEWRLKQSTSVGYNTYAYPSPGSFLREWSVNAGTGKMQEMKVTYKTPVADAPVMVVFAPE